jgi:hypothetical protein
MSAENFFETAGQAGGDMTPTMAGQRVSGRIISAMNNAPEAAQVSTVTLPADADVTANPYTTTVNGTVLTATVAAGDQDVLGAALLAAINAEGSVSRRVTASYVGGVLTLTSRFVALAFTIAAGGDNIGAVATTASADAEAIGPGLLLMGDGSHTDGIPDVGMPLSTQTVAANFIGFSIRSDRMTDATEDGDDPVYKAGVGLPLQKDGELAVEANIAPGDTLHVGTTTAERGLLFSATGTGRLAIPSSSLTCIRKISSTLAEVRILRCAL